MQKVTKKISVRIFSKDLSIERLIFSAFDFFALATPAREFLSTQIAKEWFNIQEARMNTHGRAVDCTVILINCTLNPVEMDHRLRAIISSSHDRAHARARAREEYQFIHEEGDTEER